MSPHPPARRLGLYTDAMVEGDSVVRQRIGGGTLCATPACPHTYWGHRIETDAPPWQDGVPVWLGRWQSAHGGRVSEAVLAWETEGPLSVPEQPPGIEVARFSALARTGLPPAPTHACALLGPESWSALRAMAGRVNGMGDDAASRQYLHWYWERASSWVEAGRSARFGIFVDGTLAASCGLVWEAGVARFQDVMTHPAYRRRGFARSVLSAAMQAHTEVDPNAVFVLVVEAGSAAESLYQSLGFEERSVSVALTVRIAA